MSSSEIKAVKNEFLWNLYDSQIQGKGYNELLKYGKAHGLSEETYHSTVRQDSIADFEIIDKLNEREIADFMLDPLKYLTSSNDAFNIRGFVVRNAVEVSAGYSVLERYEEYAKMYKSKYGEEEFKKLLDSKGKEIDIEQQKAANKGKEDRNYEVFNIENILYSIQELKSKKL